MPASYSSSSPPPPGTSCGNNVPVRLRAVLPGRKLAVLLSLGAAFLDQVAPTPAHPAAVHAETLRLILKAGTWGQNGDEATAQAQDEAVERERRARGGAGQAPAATTGPFNSAAQLLSAILAQVTPSAPTSEPGAPYAGSSAGVALDSRPAQTSPDSPFTPFAAQPPPTTFSYGIDKPSLSALGGFPDAATAVLDFSTSTLGSTSSASATRSAAAPPPVPSSLSTTPHRHHVIEPSQASAAQPFVGASTSFASFEPLPPVAGLGASPGRNAPDPSQLGVGMEVDADALGALDWAALEKQLGMESGSLSEGFAGSVGTTGTGASNGGAMEQLDWMGY